VGDKCGSRQYDEGGVGCVLVWVRIWLCVLALVRQFRDQYH
jgi:hypothetical protein